MPVTTPMQPTLYEEATEVIPVTPLPDTHMNATRLPAPPQPQIAPIQRQRALDSYLAPDNQAEFDFRICFIWLSIVLTAASFTVIWILTH